MPDVKGLTERLAVAEIQEAGLEELIVREPHAEAKLGIVFEQDPQPGDRIERGNFVTIRVSDRAAEDGRPERGRPEP